MKRILSVMLVFTAFGCGLLDNKGEPSTPSTFQLLNEGGSSIYGATFIVVDRPAHSKQSTCNVAGLEPASGAPADIAQPLPSRPNEPVVASWNGVISNFCDDNEYAKPGVYHAKFCYSETYYGASICTEEKPFRLGSGEEINFTIDYTAQSDETFTLAMRNDRSESIFVQTAANCVTNTWWTQQIDGEPISHDECGLCDCRETMGCNIACALACAIDEFQELAPGESIEREIPFLTARPYPSANDDMCSQPELIDSRTQFEVCYGTSIAQNELEPLTSGLVEGVECLMGQFFEIQNGRLEIPIN